jgi:hypothetical protein
MAILVLKELLNSEIPITSLINLKMNFLLPQIACETVLFILVLILVVHRLIQTIEIYIDICQHLLKNQKIEVIVVDYQYSVFTETFLTHLRMVFIHFTANVAH